MTREERLNWLEQIEKDIYVNSLESTLADDMKSCAIHSAIEALKAEPCEDVAISREHLLSEIDKLMQSSWFNLGKDMITDYNSALIHYGYVERKEAVEIVRDLCVKAEPPVTPKQRWIPLAKGMPEKDGWYLVTECGKVELRKWERNERFPNGSIGWQSNFCVGITAWMPLPEPYKAESEEV